MDYDPELLSVLREARTIVALTGAGVSAESGIPTFRDAMSGYWAKFDPQQLATPEAFARDPELVSTWYDQRRVQCASILPNSGHHALARAEKIVHDRGGRLLVATQNVDRLHQAAGSQNVVELHGSLFTWRCTGCHAQTQELGPAFTDHPPTCVRCGHAKRPGVVWFGEILPPGELHIAQDAARDCELFLSLGTSSTVYPAAGLIDIALGSIARVIEINPEPTAYSSRVEWSLRGRTGELLPALLAAAMGAA